MNGEHTVHAYDDELRQLTDTVLQMGGMVERQIADTVSAMLERDSERLNRVIETDDSIDELELDVDRQVTKMLALRQPMAVDLRSIIGALRVAGDLERMGDLAKNIAKRGIALSQAREIPSVWMIPNMAEKVRAMVGQVLDAYVDQDLKGAEQVWRNDQDVDEMYNGLFRELLTYMMEDARNITPCTHMLFAAKNLERIGDHATNIAEMINYRLTGDHRFGDRPKADDTATFVACGPAQPKDLAE
ncbi:MAG: phosphate signaling complex protein PhoU [Alphaproteobacteria bacterium]|nr:phosphate signaling complex protein PhoU [Alphaproteobacteria bacterium]